MAALMRELDNDENNRRDESTSTNIYQCKNNIFVTSEYNLYPYNNLSISQYSIDVEIEESNITNNNNKINAKS